MDGAPRETRAETGGAVVRDQIDLIASADQFGRKRLRREEMSPGASRSQYDGRASQILIPPEETVLSVLRGTER